MPAPHPARRLNIDVTVSVSDGRRTFSLHSRFATDAQVVALYGPSGSGKTLTLQAMAGLLKPTAGHIRLGERTWFDAQAGVDVAARDRRLGYLFQHYALFPHLTVRQNVAFGLTTWLRRRPAPADAARVDDLIQRFGLAELADSRPTTLSGGQRQRVALARALACEPQALLLDEPFAALNPMLRAQLRSELAEGIRQWDLPVVMITHDLDDVLALADVAMVYQQGRIVREVDLRSGEAHDRLAESLGQPARVDTPEHRRMRALLQT